MKFVEGLYDALFTENVETKFKKHMKKFYNEK